ncbi:ATP-binding protein [Nocardia caishijiensis]|uniref:ATP-binding protein n=1 Tax=Nocardia caishijiensis TaxID=184756 RepID=UPI001331797E|nr:ATP-binding protein [Nocardia caishijiensis]
MGVLGDAIAHIFDRAANQMVVIAGPPGSGKSATAIELAHKVGTRFRDGVLYFDFATAGEHPESVAELLKWALLELGVGEEIPDDPGMRRSMYAARTSGGSYVIVLDGVLSDSQVNALRPGPGTSLLLVTETRAVTRVTSGKLFVVDELAEQEALQIFAGVAGTDRVAAEHDAAREIVRLCDHLPLALVVAGSTVCRIARRHTTPLADIATRLRDERRRHTVFTPNVVFGAAYSALPGPVQRCYRALGLRCHGATMTAESMAAALDAQDWEAEDWLNVLADNHLIRAANDRYSVRELVVDHTREIDDRPATQRRDEEARLIHYWDVRITAADTLLAPARPWRPLLFPGLTAAAWFTDSQQARKWLLMSRRSIMSAAEYAVERGDGDIVVRWCVLLWPFYEKEKLLDDLLDLHTLGIRDTTDPITLAVLHMQIGYAHLWRRHFASAVVEFAKSLELSDNREVTGSALEGLGLAEFGQGDVTGARVSLRRNLEIARETGIARRIALAVFHLAKTEPADVALLLLTEARAAFLAEPTDEAENVAKVQYWQGRKFAERDDHAAAVLDYRAALGIMSDRRRVFDQAEIYVALAESTWSLGDAAEATRLFERAITLYLDSGFTDLAEQTRMNRDRLCAP